MKTTLRTRKLTLMAMFAAMAYLLMMVGRIPISSVDFLKYDPKDMVIAICGFVLGPAPALTVATVVALIEMLTVSTTGPIGFLMNLISSAMFVGSAALVYRRVHTLRGALMGLLLGHRHADGLDAPLELSDHALLHGLSPRGRGGDADPRVPALQPHQERAERRDHAAGLQASLPRHQALSGAGEPPLKFLRARAMGAHLTYPPLIFGES